MLTNLDEWAAARHPTAITVITEIPDRVWTVIGKSALDPRDCTLLGWIHRIDTTYEVTTMGDPLGNYRSTSLDAAIALLSNHREAERASALCAPEASEPRRVRR